MRAEEDQPLLADDGDQEALYQPAAPRRTAKAPKWNLIIACTAVACVTLAVMAVSLHRASPYYSSPVSRAVRYIRALTASPVTPPADWVPVINNFDMIFNPHDDTGIESDLMPLMGNGFLVQLINSGTMFVHGVFNGYYNQSSVRAVIPAPLMLVLGDSCLTPCLTVSAGALDMRNATYHRLGSINSAQGVVSFHQRYYTHRAIHSLIVSEIDLTVDKPLAAPAEVLINKLVDKSTDVALETLSSPPDRTVVVGTTLVAESDFTTTTTFAMVCSAVPASVSVSTNTSLRYVCAVRHSLECGSSTKAGVAAAANADYNRAIALGDALYDRHVMAWAELWESGVEISSRDDVALSANATLFALLASSHPTLPFGLAPGGINRCYGGHSFWDVETWMYPGLLMLQPAIARSLTEYRKQRMHGAELKAQSYGRNWTGTMFPWESASSGLEACPPAISTGELEQHISGDIAVAMQQYWWVTRDLAWLQGVGGPVLRGIADFWTSRVETATGAHAFSPDDDLNGTLHITNVIPPDEYHQGNDSVYTNAGAVLSLSYALSSSAYLGPSGREDMWLSVRDRLLIPFNASTNVHPEYVGYEGDVIKQADVVLLQYPLGYRISEASRLADLHYYDNRTDAGGPAMTWGMHSIGYLDLGDLASANHFFNLSFQAHLDGGPYGVWSEVHGGGGCHNFITGAGGYLQTLVFGWPGIRIGSDGITIRPRQLPQGATYMKVRRFHYVGNQFDLSFDGSSTTLTLVAKSEMSLSVSLRVGGSAGTPLDMQSPRTFANSESCLLYADDTVTTPPS